MSKSTKYWLATVGFAVTLFLALGYALGLATAPHPTSENPRLLAEGIALLIAASVTITVRAYYHKDRFGAGTESASASEVSVLGALGKEHAKKITVHLTVSDDEYLHLEKIGRLQLTPDRFNMPIQVGDAVRICIDSGNLERCINTLVQDIDGVNQQILLKRREY